MKQIDTYISEKLKLNRDTGVRQYNYHPEDKKELRALIEELIEERGPNADLNDIDVSGIDNMHYLFYSIKIEK